MPNFDSSLEARRRQQRASAPLWSGVVLVGTAVAACLVLLILALALLTSLL